MNLEKTWVRALAFAWRAWRSADATVCACISVCSFAAASANTGSPEEVPAACTATIASRTRAASSAELSSASRQKAGRVPEKALVRADNPLPCLDDALADPPASAPAPRCRAPDPPASAPAPQWLTSWLQPARPPTTLGRLWVDRILPSQRLNTGNGETGDGEPARLLREPNSYDWVWFTFGQVCCTFGHVWFPFGLVWLTVY